MTYLLIYLALGVLFVIIMTVHDFVIEQTSSFSLSDLFGTLIGMALWPLVIFMLVSEHLPTIDFNPDRIILWRRKTGTESPAPESPPSSNDPDI